jgi:branched-chain amino acid transport system permease protein
VLNNATNITRGANGIRSIPHFNFFGLVVDTAYSKYYVILIFAIGAYILSSRIINSRWGRAFQAIRDNETSVESNGINIARVKITAFIICCVFGSVGGALYAHLMNYINPLDFNADLSVRFLMMLMLGGIGSAPGCILGVAVVVFLPEVLKFTKGYYWFLFSFSMLLMVMFRPYGLVSIFRDGIRLINKTASQIRKV